MDIPLLADSALTIGRLPLASLEGAAVFVGSGAKVGAPAGTGWLCARPEVQLAPVHGAGPEERGVRGGSLDIPAQLALAACTEHAIGEQAASSARAAAWMETLLAALDPRHQIRPVGAGPRAPGMATLSLDGAHGDAVVMSLDLEGIAAATGAPCALGSQDPSPGLIAMGMSAREATSTLRISVDGTHTPQHAKHVARVLGATLDRIRRLQGDTVGPDKSESR